jgi:hypothetical protein
MSKDERYLPTAKQLRAVEANEDAKDKFALHLAKQSFAERIINYGLANYSNTAESGPVKSLDSRHELYSCAFITDAVPMPSHKDIANIGAEVRVRTLETRRNPRRGLILGHKVISREIVGAEVALGAMSSTKPKRILVPEAMLRIVRYPLLILYKPDYFESAVSIDPTPEGMWQDATEFVDRIIGSNYPA